MLSEFDCFNVEMGLHVLPDGFVMGVEDKGLVFGVHYIKRMFTAAGHFQKLGLSERERNLLKCIYIFSRGNSLTLRTKLLIDILLLPHVRTIDFLYNRSNVSKLYYNMHLFLNTNLFLYTIVLCYEY